MIMSEQILTSGADRSYAAAHDWIKQAASTAKTLSPPDPKQPAEGDELVGALLPIVPSEHITAIVARHISETLSTREPGTTVPPADHDTSRHADPYSARCPDCDNPTGAAAEARRLLGRWAQ
jgi:hypothetical protein